MSTALTGSWTPALAASAGTTTTLAVTLNGSPVTLVTAKSVVTLTASVQAGSLAVTAGQVNFCDASVNSCTDIHWLGTAQLTSAGTAVLRLRPGLGNHSYKAVFTGANSYATSASGASTLVVTGTPVKLASTTTIAETGGWGDYALTATVTESGGTVPPSGTVSFLDTNNGNSLLDQAALGPSVPGIDWPNPFKLVTGGTTRAVALGDFNGDGIPDLAAVGGNPQQPLKIFLGNGDGSYTLAPALSFFAYTFGPMVVADFNGDGKEDLAVLNGDSNTVSILLGNGDGTFTVAAASPAIQTNSHNIAAGDFNLDGIPDLAVTSVSSDSLNILLGKGDGTFTATPTNPVASGSPNSVVTGDFNRDGKLDLAVTDIYTDTVSILLGNGDGSFTAATSLQSGSTGSPIAAADLNGDGKLDLVVGVAGAGGASDSVTILTGNGDGTFTSSASGPAVNSAAIASIRVGDFNADGFADLALTNSAIGTFSVLLANGSGSFVSFSQNLPPDVYFQLDCAVGDVDGDGRSDLLIGNAVGSSTLYLTEATETASASADISLASIGQHLVDASYSGDTSYQASLSGTLPLWGVPPASATTLTVSSGGVAVSSVTAGSMVALTATVLAGGSPATTGQVNFCDASASQCTDIHLLGTATLSISGVATFKFVPGAGVHSYKAIFVQDGYGLTSASAVSTLTVGPAKVPVYTDSAALSIAGGPGDYSLTATVVGYGGTAAPTGKVSFLDTSFGNASLGSASLGNATAGMGWVVSSTPAVSGTTVSQVTGDFNGDGFPDLAVLSTSNIYGGPAVFSLFFGNGDGTFRAGPITQTQIQVDDTIAYIVAGDFNGDGKTDMALLTYPTGFTYDTVTTLLGHGDGTFAASAASTVYNPGPVGGDVIAGSMVTADFNGDGKLDLAVVGDYVGIGGVTVVLGVGDGTFTPAGANLEPALGYGSIAAGDFNGDGIPDLVASQYFGPGGGTVFLGKGDGTFTEKMSLTLDPFPSSILPADIDGDGKLDLLFVYPGGGSVFLGHGDGTFTQAPGSPFNGGGGKFAAADFNHDGKLDLASIDNSIDLAAIFLGAGDGTFSKINTTATVSEDNFTPVSLVAADFNGDGVPDLAALTRSPASASILLTEPTQAASAAVDHIAPVGAGTHNVVASYAGDTTYSPTVSSPGLLNAGLAPLTFSPAAGTYSTAQSITISEPVPGSTIYYWISGTFNSNGYVPYTGPILLNQGSVETIEAYATETGYQQSTNSVASYYLNLPVAAAPVFSPAAGAYPGPQTVTITDPVPGAVIYYTTNGTAPTTSSPQYSGPIAVSTSETLVAMAVANGYSLSPAISAPFVIGSSSSSFIYTVAGNGFNGYAGDGGLATTANLNEANAAVLDSAGNLYIADSNNNVIRKVAAGTGIISTIAGTGAAGYSGDRGPATNAQLNFPFGLAIDPAGNLYISEEANHVVRMITAATGIITTVAGNGSAGYSGDGGAAVSAQMYVPRGLALDGAGNLYITDNSGSRVREVVAKTGIITTIAGNGQFGYAGDGGPATTATLADPEGVALDSAGNIYIADTFNHVIRKVTAGTGIISTVAGTYPGYGSNGGFAGDGGPATSAQLNLPAAVALDSAGDLYIADTNNRAIRKVTASSGTINTVAGNATGSYCGLATGDGESPLSASICFPEGISIDAAGNLYIADSGFSRIREVATTALPPTTTTAAPVFTVPEGTYATPQTVTITDATPGASIYVTLDGTPPSTSAPGYNGPIDVTGAVTIKAVAVAPGRLTSAPIAAAYTITSSLAATIRTVAGTGVSGFTTPAGPATSARIGVTSAVVSDSSGNLFFSDTTNDVVWMLTAGTGDLSIVAGSGTPGFGGDGGPATSALLNGPTGVAIDSAGNLYIADTNNSVVRKVTARTGLIQTVAGVPYHNQPFGLRGDGGPATQAYLDYPQGLVSDAAGNLYIADTFDNEVRMVSASNGIITMVAGTGRPSSGFSGEGGLATSANLPQPYSLALDNSGNLYIGFGLGWVCKVAKATGILMTVAGNGAPYGTSGDGGLATAAEIYPMGLALDSAQNLFITNGPGAIREVSASNGIITKAVGNGYPGYSGDGGAATIAQIQQPAGIAFDPSGNLYIADAGNYRIREVSPATQAIAPGLTVSPSATSITTAESLTITVAVAGPTGGPTPTGTVALGSGGYNAQQALAEGTATFSVPAGALAVGTDTVAATYTPDTTSAAVYSTATQSTTVTVTPAAGAANASVTLAPKLTTITNEEADDVVVSVAGGSGEPAATGNVTVVSGAYSAQQALVSGAATFTIPAGALAAGSNTLTARYSGDGHYSAASGTTSITVSAVVVTASNPPPVAIGSTASTTVTFSAGSAYSGNLNLTCSLLTSPAGAKNLPACSLKPSTVTIAAGGTASATLTVSTTGNSTSALAGSGDPAWSAWGGGGILALGILFGVPSRRRRALFALVLCAISLAGVTGCGGSSSPSSTASASQPATTAGNYTFTVTGTDAATGKTMASTSLSIVVE